MRNSFAHQPSPLKIGVIREENIRSAIAAIRNAEYHGAGGIDLHLSCLKDENRNAAALRKILSAASRPVLALNYNQKYDYTGFETDEETRVSLLLEAVKAGAAAADFQGYTYDLKSKGGYYGDKKYAFAQNNPKEIVTDSKIIQKQMALFEKVHAMGAEVLLSTHPGIPMKCDEIVELALFLEERRPDIIKIVTACENEEQLIESFKTITVLKKEVRTQISFHCSGAAGRLSRIINPLLGSYLIFCSDGYSQSSNFEQPDLQTVGTALDAIRKLL